MTNKKMEAITNGSTHALRWSHINKFTLNEIAFIDEEKVYVALQNNPNPYDYFSLYLTDTILEYIIKETNLYAEQFLEKNKTNIKPCSNALHWNLTDPDFSGLRGGPFVMWGGGLWFFLHDQTFFSTPSLNVQFFQTLSKANNFFLSSNTQNNFFTIYFI